MPQPPLSSKEQSLFRQLVKNYESKQYKKGLKAADQILRKTPNHGDTQAFKALLLNSLNQSDEAFALAKMALKNDMKSHVCWHVYGLLWRSVKNFDEAIKAYKFALKLEPEAPQILRDLALLQIQMRDYQGYIQSRRLMLQSRPQLRQNWTGMAVAHHLAGDLVSAENVLTTYEETLKSPPPRTDIEHSEAVLYKNIIIAEMGQTERALEHLEAVKRSNLDRTAVMEMRAQYLMQLERKTEAEQAYRELLARNGEYRRYYQGLESSLGLERTNKQELKELYGSYAQAHDRIDAARRIPLDFLDGDEFRDAADHYLRRMLQKGVPSTFNNIKALYVDRAKQSVIERLVEEYSTTKQVNGHSEHSTNGDRPDRFEESVVYFLVQHYNYKSSRNLGKAMNLVDKLINMSPKMYDYHMTKARILKHLGKVQEAAQVMNHARELDTKDRYINTKCAKYQLRNNENDIALKTMSKFTRNETVGGTLGDLLEMQCLWYLTEDGEAYARQGKYGQALKRFHSIHDIFEQWQEDQFDFHSFSLRKGQIRAYVEMVRWEDHLREHPFYVRAAVDAIRVYIILYDRPQLAQDGYSIGMDEMNEEDRRKALRKAKKDREQDDKRTAEEIEANKKVASKKANATAEGEMKKVDVDPRGIKLLEVKDPLKEAMKFLNALIESSVEHLGLYHAGFEVYIRRKKYYLALKCILGAFNLSLLHPTNHEQAVRFRYALSKEPSDTTSAVLDLANSAFPTPYNTPSTSMSSLNEDFISKNPHSTPHAASYLKVRQLLDPNTKPKNLEALLECFDADQSLTFDNTLQCLTVLRDLGGGQEVRKRLIAQATTRWPDATSILERELLQ